jgi:hypothetical protein
MSIYIPHVEYGIDAQYIANVFYCQNIATVKRITLVPYVKAISKYDYICLQRAYIDIHNWHDSEVAYSFIHRILDEQREARIIYDIIDEACWWVVEENKKPWITKCLQMRKKTTEFEIIDNDESIADILFELDIEEMLKEDEEDEDIEELEKLVHPVDDDLEWKELEELMRNQEQQRIEV